MGGHVGYGGIPPSAIFTILLGDRADTIVFALGRIDEVQVEGGAGDDSLSGEVSRSSSVQLYGGRGDDVLRGGPEGNGLVGGRGTTRS
jgi:hypothetical protein